MASLGKLNIVLGAVTKDLVNGLNQADQKVGAFDQGMGKVVKRMAQVGVAMAAAGAAITAALVKQSFAAIDTQAKLAQRLGGTTAAVQALEHAADLAGVSKGALTSAADKLNQRLGEAERKGMGPAKEALDRLGLSARELSAMDIDERFATLADRMKDAGFSTQQMADTMRDLGVRQSEVINLMVQGGDAIRGSRNEVEAFGVAVTQIEAKQIEAANDAFTRAKLAITGVANQIAVKLAPVVEAILVAFGDAAAEANGFKSAVDSAFTFVVKAAGFVADAVMAIRIAWQGLTVAAEASRVAFAHHPLFLLFNGTDGIKNAKEGLAAARQELDRLMSMPVPSRELDNWVESVRIASEKAAAEAAKVFSVGSGDGETEQSKKVAEAVAKQQEAERARLEQRMESLRLALLTEEEAEIESYNRRLEEIALFRENELLSLQEAQDMKERATAEHLDKIGAMEKRASDQRKAIQDQETRARQQAWAGFWNNMTGLMNSGSRAMFNIGKVAAIAKGMLDMGESIMSSFAYGSRIGGPYLGAAFAAAAGAAQLANLASIRSTQFGGGGAGGAAAAGGGTVSSQALAGTGADANTRRMDQTIFLSGLDPSQIYRGSDLINSINEAIRNGARINLVAG